MIFLIVSIENPYIYYIVFHKNTIPAMSRHQHYFKKKQFPINYVDFYSKLFPVNKSQVKIL